MNYIKLNEGEMISQTQKEIWIREAAARLTYPEKMNTFENDIMAIMKGDKFLTANENAKKLAFNVIDVVCEKIGIVLKDMIQESSDDSEEDTIKNVAYTLGIDLK